MLVKSEGVLEDKVMDIFVARQPIFDKKQKVFAYELLYRNGIENYCENIDGDKATSMVIINSFLSIGIETLTNNKRAFINFTENLIRDEIPTLFPNKSIVVEILEDVKPDEEVIKKCKKLKSEGYILALDDFIFKDISIYKRFIDVVDIVKVDFMQNSFADRAAIVKELKNSKIKFLAEKVESREEYFEAIEMGYEYFQGYFFSKPVIVSGKDISSSKLNCMEILNEINRPEPDYNKLASIVERDISLSYKLLRVINFPAFYTNSRITSIKQALVLFGFKGIRKWISLIFLRDIGKDKPDEILKSALVRGKLGEFIAPKVGLKDRKSELFIMGLFSVIDVVMDKPLGEILKELPLSEDIKEALLGKENKLNDIYRLILSYEKGDWQNYLKYSNKLKLKEVEIPKHYIEVLEWVEEIFSSV